MPGTATPVLDDLIVLPLKRAAQLAGVTLWQMYYWDNRHLVSPGIRQRVNLHTTVRLYRFDDLVDLLIVATLRRRGFSLQKIRKVLSHLHSRGYEKPLRQLEFATSGKEIFFRHPDGSWEGDRAPDQLVLREVIDLDLIRRQIRQSTVRPSEFAGRTTRRPGTRGSKLIFEGTRIPVDAVVRRLKEKQSTDQILEAFPDLTSADVDAARAHVALGA